MSRFNTALVTYAFPTTPQPIPGFGALPLTDPRYSMREACKQIVLLEQHLCEPERECADCIRKHLLTAEGHLEEALDLGAEDDVFDVITTALPQLRALARAWYDGDLRPRMIGARLRQLRKTMLPICFDAGI